MKVITLATLPTIVLFGSLCSTHSLRADETPGNWGTWLSATSDTLEVKPPNSPGDEIHIVKQRIQSLTKTTRFNVFHWPASNANYRWMQMALNRYAKGPPSPRKGRGLALLNVAIYDAVASATNAKSTFKRERPEIDDSLLARPQSYSYPSAHAAAAGAAAEVLAYLFPDEAEFFTTKALQAADARVDGGVNFPSDVDAGLQLGKQAGLRSIAIAAADGSDSTWSGTRPVGPDKFKGEMFVYPAAGSWRTWSIESVDDYLPPPPAALNSPELANQLKELHAIERKVPNAIRAWVNHSTYRAYQWWYEQMATYVFERADTLSTPETALRYATVSAANHDAILACFNAKYTYWFIRPRQLDPDLATLFPNPPHPSYPAAHSCSSMNYATSMGQLFPEHATQLQNAAEEAGMSRLIAGIHYPMDKQAGEILGERVAANVLAHADTLRGIAD